MSYFRENTLSILLFASALILVLGCKPNENNSKQEVTMQVTATAYNSVNEQTKTGNPNLAAWGDILEPGEKAIAVSRDLIKLGLKHNKKVKIKGLSGTYIVKDKMNKRWTKKIDIYMGLDKEAALEWGKQKVEITFSSDIENKNQSP